MLPVPRIGNLLSHSNAYQDNDTFVQLEDGDYCLEDTKDSNDFSKPQSDVVQLLVLNESGNPHNPTNPTQSTQSTRTQLKRKLAPVTVQLIAIGSALGTGLLIGSGKCVAAGPLPMLMGYAITSVFIYLVLQALGELTVAFPVNGGFTNYASLLLGRSWGFTLAWNYGLQWATLLPMQLLAAQLTVSYWNHDSNNVFPVMLVMFAVVIVVNLCSVAVYGYLQTAFSIIKLVALALFAIAALGINMGLFSNRNSAVGFGYWKQPGMVLEQGFFGGLIVCIITSVFSFAGTELVSITASEQTMAEQTVPTTVKQVCWRIISVYMTCIGILSVCVPYNSPGLIGAGGNTSSPFVLALGDLGIGTATMIPSHAMNGVVLVAILSLGLSSVYAASRTMVALAENGHAPRVLSTTNENGTPYVAVLSVGLLGVWAAIIDFWPQLLHRVLFWLISYGGVSVLFSYVSICMCHIQFRRALRSCNIGCERLYFQALCGIAGSVVAVIMAVVLLLLQPILMFISLKSVFSVTLLLESCSGFIVILGLWIPKAVYNSIRKHTSEELNITREDIRLKHT